MCEVTGRPVRALGDEILNLIVGIQVLVAEIIEDWRGSKTTMERSYGYSEVYTRWMSFVIDHVTGDTIIPAYQEYKRVWVKSKYANPFEFHWMDTLHLVGECTFYDYISMVVEILGEQLDMYKSDPSTNGSSLCQKLIRFTHLLEMLCIELYEPIEPRDLRSLNARRIEAGAC